MSSSFHVHPHRLSITRGFGAFFVCPGSSPRKRFLHKGGMSTSCPTKQRKTSFAVPHVELPDPIVSSGRKESGGGGEAAHHPSLAFEESRAEVPALFWQLVRVVA